MWRSLLERICWIPPLYHAFCLPLLLSCRTYSNDTYYSNLAHVINGPYFVAYRIPVHCV